MIAEVLTPVESILSNGTFLGGTHPLLLGCLGTFFKSCSDC